MPLSDVLDMPTTTISAPDPSAADIDFDPMSGDTYAGATPPTPAPLGVPANNSIDQAEQARLQNNAGAIRTFGPNAPQQPPPPPQAPAGPRPGVAAPPPGIANAQPVGGVGAYGAGGTQGPDSGLTPQDMAVANWNAGQLRPGFHPTTRSTETSGNPEGDEAAANLIKARADEARMQQRYAVAAGQELQAAGLDSGTLARQQRQMLLVHQRELAEHVQKIQQLQDNASKAAHEEPEDFWGGDDMAKRIPRTLGMALMAFGHGLNPNAPNPMEYMSTMIKQAADKQKQKYEAARGDEERATNLYGMMKQKFGDDESALVATQMMQKQAVLDGIDKHFAERTAAQKAAAPVRTTWGGDTGAHEIGAKEPPQDEYAGLGPTAALGLAQSRRQLAESIAGDIKTLDTIMVHNKVSANESYREPTLGRDPLKVYERAAEIAKYKGTAATALPAAEAGVRKENAAAGAEEAKAAAAAGGGPDRKVFDQARDEIHSVAFTANPDQTISQYFQGTEGQKNRLKIDAYNAFVTAKFNETHKGLARSAPQQFQEGLKAYTIDPNVDRPITIQRKLSNTDEFLFHGNPNPVAGEQVDSEGQGEEHE